MSDGLTARQTQILKSLIDEYLSSAEAVGSEVLERKYNLGISPATVRNEMVALTSLGFLKQPHASAGRLPTPKAMKFYVDQLMEERQMSLADEVKAKEEVWDVRDDIDQLMSEATQALAQRTKSIALATLDEEPKIWHSGYANIFSNPEFSDPLLSTNFFSFLEEFRRIHEVFFERMPGTSPIEMIFGEDMGWQELSCIGVVGTRVRIKDKNGAIGVVGTSRLQYPTIIPILKYFKNMIEEVSAR